MPTYDARCTQCEFTDEIVKPREAALPACPDCGGELKQVYHVPVVHYAVSGFAATDGRLEKLVGHKRFADFEAKKHDAETRARRGQLTNYERALETA